MALPALLLPIAARIAARYLPTLTRRFGGEAGEAVVREVVDIATEIAGLPPGTPPELILTKIEGDPAKETELQLRLEEVDQRAYELAAADRDSARRYQASVGWQGRVRGTIMLGGVIAGLIACVVTVFQGSPAADPGALALITTIAGALLKMMSDAFAFEFGSSAGSKEKSAIIEEMTAVATRIRSAPPPPVIQPVAAIPVAAETLRPSAGATAAPRGIAESEARPIRDFVSELREA